MSEYTAKRLKELRKKAKLTQKKAASLARIGVNTLFYIEDGRSTPRDATLTRLLNVYAERIQHNQRVDKILTGEPHA